MATIRELVTLLGFDLKDAPLKEYERKIQSAKKKTEGLSSTMKGVGTAIKWIGGAVAAAGFAALGKSILDTTGEVEQYRVTLGTMIGDQEKANKIIHDLDYSPVSDFYGTAAAIGGLQGMVTFGMQAEEASETLTRLGDIAQGNGEAFKSLSLNMGQVFAKGKADATDLKQFVGQGFDVVGEISKMTGKSRAEIEKAGVSYEQCAAALKNITSEGGKYNGMLAKQSQTLPGLIKQFQSLSAAIKESIGTAVLDNVKKVMQYFLQLGRSMQDNIAAVGTKVFDTVIRGVVDVIEFFEILIIRMKKFGGAFTPIKELISDVFGLFGSVIESAYPFLMNLVQMILLAFKPLKAFVSPVLEALKGVFGDVFKYAAEVVGKLIPIVDSLTPSFKHVGELVANVFGKLRPIIKKLSPLLTKLADMLTKAFEPIKKLVLPIFDVLKRTVGSAFDAICNALEALLGVTMDSSTGFSDAVGIISDLFCNLGDIAADAISSIAELLPKIFDFGMQILQKLVEGIMNALPVIAKAAVKVIKSLVSTLAKLLPDIVKAGMQILSSLIVGLVDMLPSITDAAIEIIVTLVEGIVDMLPDIIDAGIQIVVSLIQGLVDMLPRLIESALKLVISIATAIVDNLPRIIDAGIKIIVSLIDGIVSAIPQLITQIVALIPAVVQAIVDNLPKIVEAGINILLSLINGITGAIPQLVQSIVELIPVIVSTIVENLPKILEMGVQVIVSLITGLVQAIPQLVAAIPDIVMAVIHGLGSLVTGVFDIGKAVVEGLWNGISSLGDWIDGKTGGFFSGLWEKLKNSPAEALEHIKSAFFGVFDGIKNKFSGIIDGIKQGWDSVKGFFGGAVDAVKGVASNVADTVSSWMPWNWGKSQDVNDLIVTPDGTYSTHPDDYIMAMKNPSGIFDTLANLLQSAIVPATLSGSTASLAAQRAVNYDNSRYSSTQSFNTPITVTVNASGMTAEQARFAVEGGVRNALREAIAGSRGVIPSPESWRS